MVIWLALVPGFFTRLSSLSQIKLLFFHDSANATDFWSRKTPPNQNANYLSKTPGNRSPAVRNPLILTSLFIQLSSKEGNHKLMKTCAKVIDEGLQLAENLRQIVVREGGPKKVLSTNLNQQKKLPPWLWQQFTTRKYNRKPGIRPLQQEMPSQSRN